MFYQNMHNFIEDCLNELKTSQDIQIQKYLKEVTKNLKEEGDDFLKAHLRVNLSKMMIGNVTEDEADGIFIEDLGESVKRLEYLKKSIVLNVAVEYQEENINRVIEIPYMSSLADMAYIILAAFRADGSHLFMVKHKKVDYQCDRDEYYGDGGFASETFLPDLKLRKNSKMRLWYDFGDDFYFTIQVMEIKKQKKAFRFENIKILSGKGYGIWEDAHYAMDLYYYDRQKFAEYIASNCWEEDYFPVHEEFVLEQLNEKIVQESRILKHIYEDNI